MHAKAFLTKQPSADQMSFPPDEKCAAAISHNETVSCIQLKKTSQRIFSHESDVSELLWIQVAFLHAYEYHTVAMLAASTALRCNSAHARSPSGGLPRRS